MMLVLSMITPSFAAFTSVKKVPLRAKATVTGSIAPPISINALPLATTVTSGKHFVIPVEIVTTNGAPVTTGGLRVDVVYQMFNESGAEASQASAVPITFQQDPTKPSRILGTAYIPRAELNTIASGGTLGYFFLVRQGNQGTYLGNGNAAAQPYPAPTYTPAALAGVLQANGYSVKIVNTVEFPVGPQGSVASLADTFQTDGKTAVRFEPGALSSVGTLRIEQLKTSQLPAGPQGAQAVVAYNMSLTGASLNHPVLMSLSYPADLNGRIADINGNPADLAPYWWDGYSWRLLARPKIDTTLHTVSAMVPSMSDSRSLEGSFALFPIAAGAISANLRPAERIITPNGDGINDEAGFSGLTGADDVRIMDLRGRRVRTLTTADTCHTLVAGPTICWDGRDDHGETVEGGVYIYQFTSQGERVSGVIAVAK